MSEETKQAAAYVGFTTFRSAIEALANGVVTNRIDRSTFPGYAGGVQSQLLAGFKFLGLTSADGRPAPVLHQLAVKDENARKSVLGSLLRVRYPALFALDLEKTTPAELAERMAESYGVSGDTKEKAVRFFVSAAVYAGIPVSPLLLRAKGPVPGAQRRRRQKARNGDSTQASPPVPPPPPQAQVGGTSTTKVITLRSGGQLSLSANVDVLKLKGEDRAFVFKLIDEIDAYELAGEADDEEVDD